MYFAHIKFREPAFTEDLYNRSSDAEEATARTDDDLWFLPALIEDEPDDLPPGPRAEQREIAVLDDWRRAEAGHAARLARVAGRLGALDERLKRGPEGWRHLGTVADTLLMLSTPETPCRPPALYAQVKAARLKGCAGTMTNGLRG